MQIWLSFLCRSMPMCSTAGLHHLAAIDRVNGCGASATTFGGGQPLHPIYRHTDEGMSASQGERFGSRTATGWIRGGHGVRIDRFSSSRGAVKSQWLSFDEHEVMLYRNQPLPADTTQNLPPRLS